MESIRISKLLNAFHPSRSSLRRNFVWTFTGNTIYSACQWALLSVLAKLTSPEAVGKYALAVAVTAPLMYIANFNIGVMLVTDTRRQFRFQEYRTARLILIALSFLATIVICWVSRFSAEVMWLTLIVGVAQFSDCLSELYRSVMFRSEQMSRVAISLILRGLFSVIAAAFVLYRTNSLLWALTAMALSRIAVLVAFDMQMGRDIPATANFSYSRRFRDWIMSRFSIQRITETIHFPAILRITRTALPLTIVTVLTSLVLNLPRYFIEHFVGHRELGIFAAMWSLLTAGNMIAIALGQAIFPRLSKLYADHDLGGFRRLLTYAIQSGLVLGLLGVVGSIIAGRQILTLAYRAEYAERHWMFVAVMATGTLVYVITLLGNAATSARAFKHQALVMGAVTTTTLIGSAVLVPKFGVWGAIGAVGMGCLTHIAGLTFIVISLLKRQDAISVISSLSPEGA
jgi:O-antigen/teichoic acid export membrane protein